MTVAELTAAQQLLLWHIPGRGWHTPAELAQLSGLKANGAGMALKSLATDGLAEFEWVRNSMGNRHHRRYRLTPQGRAAQRLVRKVMRKHWGEK
jgi:DNA-binding MarR family transcriptional regulator